MPIISGPQLDKLKADALDWYYKMRTKLIADLEKGYPYGAVHLTPAEQYQNFIQMQPEDWSALIAQLTNRYRGEPHSEQLVNADLSAYAQKMLEYGQRSGQGEEV